MESATPQDNKCISLCRNASGKVAFGEVAQVQVNCIVKIITGKNDFEKTLSLECELKGKLHFEMFDLLGNQVTIKDIEKKSYKLVIPVEAKLYSGIYIIRIAINGDNIYFKKINIAK